MKQEGTNWFDGLKAFATSCRVKHPLIDRGDLSTADEMQCRIIGGNLISWLNEHGARLLEERAVLADLKGWEKDPFIVFTSEQPGLVAAREIIEDASDTIVFLRPAEFSEWLKDHPDKEYCWHVHTWSYFAPLGAETEKKADEYILEAGESYWLHKEGTMCGQLFGRGSDHLWKWNGKEPELLQEALDQWVS